MIKSRLFTVALATALTFSPVILAGGNRQGGGSAGQGSQGGRGAGAGQQQGQAAGTRSRQAQRSQARVQATSTQRNQYQAACAGATQARQQVQSMIRTQKKTAGDTSQARAHRDRLAESVRTIEREHRQLVGSLDGQQQDALQERVRSTERSLAEMNERYRSLDRALEDPSTDGAVITERARELDRAMKSWQKEYRKLGSEMGVEAG